MKMLKIGLTVLFTTSLLLIGGCATTGTQTDGNALTGTRWHYMDDQWEYDMSFMPNGVLHTTHPNDKTPNNDTWEQNDTVVKFHFNNKFSNYEGKLSGQNLMSGTATNVKSKSWNWKATRID